MEDAANLYFPHNDIIKIKPSKYTKHCNVQQYVIDENHQSDANIFSEKCNYCYASINEPYIHCAECSELFCLPCFASGRETGRHVNNHAYHIIRNDNFTIFPMTNWSAQEEQQLLNLLSICGYFDWEDIAKTIQTRTANECREHYERYYFGGIFKNTLGLWNEPYKWLTIPFLYKMKSTDPPRPELDSINFKTMAGYRCARGEFDTPFDNSAESIVSNLELNCWQLGYDQDVGDILNCAIFSAYNHRLRERKRRYKIMREHGLLVTNRTLSWFLKHGEALGFDQRAGSGSCRFTSLLQLTTGFKFDALVESLQYAHDLKKYIFRLHILRKNGITTFRSGQVYCKLRAQRSEDKKDKKLLKYESQIDWKQFIPNGDLKANPLNIPPHLLQFNPVIKRKSTPLNILGLPMYEKLDDDEKALCSRIRLIPTAYLNYKNILLTENAKIGFLRLAEARKLIKIDVNKTRQMYDFLMNGGFINKPFE